MAALASGGVAARAGGQVSRRAGLGWAWAAFYLALAAVFMLGGCLPCTVAGASRCVQNSVMVCSGSQYEEALDCSATVPPTKCAAGSDGLAYCRVVAP